jgi:hypothetical protein
MRNPREENAASRHYAKYLRSSERINPERSRGVLFVESRPRPDQLRRRTTRVSTPAAGK